jgi:cystathionine gamma-synthase/cystathionine gamma-lyase/cystathionine beta-lyase
MPAFDTRLVHAGEQRLLDGTIAPVVRSTVNRVAPDAAYEDIRYPRLSNLPNQTTVADKLADLEGAEVGLVTASGMAAISAALFAVLAPGDHVLVQSVTYGATHVLACDLLRPWGVEVDLVSGVDPDSWRRALRPNTKAIYVETISNPLLRVTDLEAVVAFAREHGLVSLADHTFATPVLVPGAAIGIDLVLHSATKYLNGHSDVCAGAVLGSASRIHDVKARLQLLGGSLDPEAAWLLHRGVKTLGLRFRAQCANAMRIAAYLHERGVTVHYPGLPTHPDHAVARRLFGARFGGMVAMELDGAAAAERFMDTLAFVFPGPSLGGLESSATRPAATSHAKLGPAQRAEQGIADGLVRLSIGIEDADDLIADLRQALDRL